jgi:hypothetical protein
VALLGPLSVLGHGGDVERLSREALRNHLMLQVWINVALYSLPALVASLIFGFNNLRCGRDRTASIIGLLLAGSSLVAAGILTLVILGR